jgi:hypothetical protein
LRPQIQGEFSPSIRLIEQFAADACRRQEGFR